MSTIENRSGRWGVSGAVPELITQAEINKLFLDIVEKSQKIERNYMGRDEVDLNTRTSGSMMLVCGSDLHIASLATDHQKVKDLFSFVMNNKNAMLVLLGDEIEGLKEKYMQTNTARTVLDAHKQMDIMAEMLRPLVEADKIAAMVSGYWGHNGWIEDSSTINPWILLADKMGFDQRRIIKNGGRINFRFPNGYTHSETIWHNPAGKSKFDSVYGLRNAVFATSESSRSNGYMSAHLHRMGVAKELFSGAKTSVYFIASGTAKGSSPEKPADRFGIKLGATWTDPLGQGVIVEPRKPGRKEKSYPFASFEQGQKANNALRLLDWVESKGMTAELLEKIRAEVESKPKITLIDKRSKISGEEHTEDTPVDVVKVEGGWVTNPYSKMKMKPTYDTLTYDVKSKLPVTLHLLGNTRLGSSSEGYEELKKYHEELVVGNPHSLVVFLRNMIDTEAGSSPQRMEILNRFRDVINGAKDQTLAIMMCESMRNSSWRFKVKTGEEFRDANGNVVDIEDFGEGDVDEEGKPMNKPKKINLYSMPLAPGSYLSNATETPLIHHLSLIEFTVGPNGSINEKPKYTGRLADKLMKHASYSRPEFGLKRMYDLYTQEKPGFVAGGHMQHAGSMMFYDGSNAETKTPILIAPGWFAKYVDTLGKGNVMPGSAPGQAIIFMPGTYFAYPTVDADETGYMQKAFTLMTGVELLGLTDQVMGRRRK
ncbi:MAG: hypothetical protein UX08_C0027G0005 [Candidatus Collierbacteria bacterium GW2011_GWB1_45_35]|uniref:Uncharacterized protein n=2 Tax=Candidatus Collieribacteriota TaxID=1752725 RepID=A0A0G1NLR0_9BACT|nr:MAG: hypothetical protein UW48_C0022G0003 [Microgenomates group bacterium GW2011_GWC1_44_23]KKT85129.1 MAG: hypothetical protein UW84_C0041G0004 [Candidatus Collierbacteria bacterium GW2011_GWA2_44_99]KKT98948.1 MAG: hypothetical protein UX01_C0016G0005 [Candidatus Collierbacteria bacterium GW2011_GWB2_45_17]KKU04409.1 MAG: hypothetical protein UX08_C0027G0005 [Candidatus Collierbacteria bacterium GW2011_GWB1_45_35]KKU06720.1 MAG: hypothetical protein UX11_C0029G0003 [Candidatus Collierbacte